MWDPIDLNAEAVDPSFQDHELRSYPFLLSATYEADRLAVTGAINQEQRVTLDASYDVAAFSLYGDFDFMSREGRIGTKISFLRMPMIIRSGLIFIFLLAYFFQTRLRATVGPWTVVSCIIQPAEVVSLPSNC